MHSILHWLAYMTGSLNTPGAPPNYNFWSGVGSDLGEVTIIAALITVYRKHNCHVHRCWRIAKFTVAGTPYVVCKKHHPGIPDTPLKAGDLNG
jgi:hypothetical protein